MFLCQFRAKGQLVICTRCSFFKKVADFKNNDSCAECFDANFEQQDSCARWFAQGLSFKKKSPISRTRTVAQSVLTPISSKRIVVHGTSHKVYHPNNMGKFEAKRQLRGLLWGQSWATARLHTQVFISFILNSKSNFLDIINHTHQFREIDSCKPFLPQALG